METAWPYTSGLPLHPLLIGLKSGIDTFLRPFILCVMDATPNASLRQVQAPCGAHLKLRSMKQRAAWRPAARQARCQSLPGGLPQSWLWRFLADAGYVCARTRGPFRWGTQCCANDLLTPRFAT